MVHAEKHKATMTLRKEQTMYILLYVCAAAVLLSSGKAGYTRFLQMRCKGTVTGHYLYSEKRLRVIGRKKKT